MKSELERDLFPAELGPPAEVTLIEPPMVRTPAVYAKHAYPTMTSVGLMAAVCVAVAAGSILAGVAAGIGWAGLSFLFLRSRWTRALVDRKLDQLQREFDAQVRARLLQRMSDLHRRKLEEIEALIDDIRGMETEAERAVAKLVESPIDLDTLPSTYVRSAIAHQKIRELLGETNRARLAEEIHTLDESVEDGPDSIRPAMRRRLAVLSARADQWDQRLEEANAIEMELETIEDLVRLLHDLATSASPAPDTSQIDAVLGSLGEIRATSRELIELGRSSAPIRSLENGRVRRPRGARRSYRREVDAHREGLW